MGCISSKPSIDQQVTIPSKTNHTIDDHVLKLIPPKHDNDNNNDDTLTVHTNINNLKVSDNVSERCSRIHTVEEYDELLKRISDHKQAELAPVTDTTENGDSIETMDKKKLEFQTVASLRQWLNAPGGGGDVDVAASAEYANLKAGFSFYGSDNNSLGAEEKSGRQEEGESIVELVAAFDKYMQQLQIDEENFLKQIHIIN